MSGNLILIEELLWHICSLSALTGMRDLIVVYKSAFNKPGYSNLSGLNKAYIYYFQNLVILPII